MRNSFNHTQFVKNILDESPDLPHSPSGMERMAILGDSYLSGGYYAKPYVSRVRYWPKQANINVLERLILKAINTNGS